MHAANLNKCSSIPSTFNRDYASAERLKTNITMNTDLNRESLLRNNQIDSVSYTKSNRYINCNVSVLLAIIIIGFLLTFGAVILYVEIRFINIKAPEEIIRTQSNDIRSDTVEISTQSAPKNLARNKEDINPLEDRFNLITDNIVKHGNVVSEIESFKQRVIDVESKLQRTQDDVKPLLQTGTFVLLKSERGIDRVPGGLIRYWRNITHLNPPVSDVFHFDRADAGEAITILRDGVYLTVAQITFSMMPGGPDQYVSYATYVGSNKNLVQCQVPARNVTQCSNPKLCLKRRFTDTCLMIAFQQFRKQDRLTIRDVNENVSDEGKLDVAIDKDAHKTFWGVLLVTPATTNG